MGIMEMPSTQGGLGAALTAQTDLGRWSRCAS
jgi:hypothetical protein